MRTEADILKDIETVNVALQEIISGNRVNKLQVGTAEFTRTYEYAEITYELLKQEKNNLQDELDSLLGETTVNFRSNGTIPLIYRKLG